MSSKPQNTPNQSLINALLASYREQASQLSGRTVWLACSGGRDSLSLAALCQQLYLEGQLPFSPQLLHVNHGLQAANSEWAQQVQAWATAHDMPCQVLSVKIDGRDEQAARNARYTAMMQVMNKDDVLMLGHHGDDQAETVLMRLLNGAGVHGLAGMRAWTQKHSQGSEDAQQSIYLWRPWLSVSREQITAYANTVGLDYIDDPTNVIASAHLLGENKPSLSFAEFNDRAWLRSVIMPQLQARFPQASTAIMRSGQLLQEASTIVTAQAQQDIEDCLYQEAAKPKQLDKSQDMKQRQSILDIELLLALPSARQAAAIHQWLSPARDDLPAPKRLVDEVRELCTRSDQDHQTCLIWHSKPTNQQASQKDSNGNSQYYYEVRRYQQQLLRLRSDWVAWLDAPPVTQSWPLVAANSQPSHSLSLKLVTLKTHWQLHHLTELTKALVADISADNTAQGTVELQPLPRELKVTLAGRKGRKSGKKLLQALGVPAFMRESVVLCTLKLGANKTAAETNSTAQTPLFILTLHGMAVLESPYEHIVQAWLAHHAPVMQLRHNQS